MSVVSMIAEREAVGFVKRHHGCRLCYMRLFSHQDPGGPCVLVSILSYPAERQLFDPTLAPQFTTTNSNV
jgi:hypothetical protein